MFVSLFFLPNHAQDLRKYGAGMTSGLGLGYVCVCVCVCVCASVVDRVVLAVVYDVVVAALWICTARVCS